MRYIKWGLITLVVLLVGSFLHYTLPQHDIVRIVGTENRRIDIGANSLFWARSDVGTANSTSRDVYFINAVKPNGGTIEYRNEDTGWGWPPYFKVNSAGLHTKAKDLTSSATAPIWVSVTHYGWRNGLFSIFPNAVGVKQVDGPDATIIPWANIIILIVALAIFGLIWRMWSRFRARVIDPAVVRTEVAMERADQRAEKVGRGIRGFWSRLFGGKPKV